MESTERLEITAPTVDEAVILGLARLGLAREEVEIEVLDEGSRGFLGLGTREAQVRLTPKPPAPELPASPAPPAPVVELERRAPALAPAPPPVAEPPAQPAAVVAPSPQPPQTIAPVAAPPKPVAPARPEPAVKRPAPATETLDRQSVEQGALEVAGQLFAALSLQYQTLWREEDERPALWLIVRGKDANALVGHHAKTLDTVQYLFRMLVRRRVDGDYDLVLDADGYRERRLRNLQSLAAKTADRVVSSGRMVRLRPMPSHERRLIHMFLREDARVKTHSVGKGQDRAVTVVPANEDEA